MVYFNNKKLLFGIMFLLLSTFVLIKAMNKTEKNHWKNKIKEMFNHAFNSYMTHAYPADELMPLSCKGRYRGSEPSRGDIDESLGNFSLTLVDTLDTLAIIGDIGQFENAVKLVIENVQFETDVIVSVFEMNIRIVGGLLGGHVIAENFKKNGMGLFWYNKELLNLAKDAATRLLPAFNTTTGIPLPRVNLKYGTKYLSNFRETCTACAGTMILEMAALSRLTGDMIFERNAVRALDALWSFRHRGTDLMGTILNVHSGEWIRRDSGLGAGIDSYYEYLLKAYILLGEDKYLHRFTVHYAALKKHVYQSGKSLPVDVHMHKPESLAKAHVDALLAFWPGLQVLAGDISSAIELHEVLYQVTQRHGFLPEAFTTDFRVHWGHHPLRPEFIESTYLLYEATNDPHYLRIGAGMIEKINEHARVDCGFAAIQNVKTRKLDDQMDSFVLAETFKYLYLLFSEPNDLKFDPHKYLLTTEAHFLPLSSLMQKSSQNISTLLYLDIQQSHRNCPNIIPNVEKLRLPLKDLVPDSCPKIPTNTIPKRLSAKIFSPDNSEHLHILKNMGVKLVTMQDGRVQLVHSMTDAKSATSAQEGMLFMQEMIELSKNTQEQGMIQEPRVIQLLSSPHFGNKVFFGGPAQFGLDLSKNSNNGLEGKLAIAQPFQACSSIENPTEVYSKIVLVKRGGCMFIDKARQLQRFGAHGGIILDDNEGSSRTSSPLFAMSGDGTDDVHIPLIFLFHDDGVSLLKEFEKNANMKVYLSANIKATETVDNLQNIAPVKESNDIGDKFLSLANIKLLLTSLTSHIVHTDIESENDNAIRLLFDLINNRKELNYVPKEIIAESIVTSTTRLIELLSKRVTIADGSLKIFEQLIDGIFSDKNVHLTINELEIINSLKTTIQSKSTVNEQLHLKVKTEDIENNNEESNLNEEFHVDKNGNIHSSIESSNNADENNKNIPTYSSVNENTNERTDSRDEL